MAKRAKARGKAKRPLGVTIICIVGFLGSILAILGGLGVTVLGALTIGFIGLIGGAVMIIGFATLFAFYLLWKMKNLGWTLVMILEALGLLLALVQLNFVNMVVPVIVLIYLWMKKDLFK